MKSLLITLILIRQRLIHMNVINNAISPRKSSLRQSIFKIVRNSCSNMSQSNPTRGLPIEYIRGSEEASFPLVWPGRHHTVLYYVPSDGTLKEYPPKPLRGEDKWDHDHVRLPCSIQSEYPVENYQKTRQNTEFKLQPNESQVRNRWQMIRSALKGQILNSKQLAEAILSYNHTYRKSWKFTALHALFENLDEDESEKFFVSTLPAIVKLALALPELIQSPIPLLKQGQNRSISLSQQQISCLLANAFFCTFPRRNLRSQKEYASYPHINFASLYEMEPHQDALEKLKCLIQYFVRVTQRPPRGVVTFSRRAVPADACPPWERSDAPLSRVPLHIDPDGMIERADGLIQLDFANKYLGGGVLGHGCVQEEIRFVTCPELMASMLFTEELAATEALVIIGAERYTQYLGYGSTFEWANAYTDLAPMDHSGRKNVAVLAIDALPFRNVAEQFKKQNIDRELNKAWVGFSAYSKNPRGNELNYPGVATGNWGCGAFRGSPPLKSLIQLMACAEARRPMAYYTFKDYKLRDEFMDIYERLCRHNVTVGQLYKYIRNADSDNSKSRLFDYLRQVLQDERRSAPARGQEATTSRDPADQVTPRHQENAPRSDSPDLFSQDEEQNQETDKSNHLKKQETQNHANIDDRRNAENSSNTKIYDSTKDYIMTDSEAQILESLFDKSDSDLQMSDDNKLTDENSTKMLESHTRLQDASTSLSHSSTNLPNRMSDSDIKNFVNHTKMPNRSCDDVKICKNEVKITIQDSEDTKSPKVKENHENENPPSNKSSNHRLSLFEEMQKFDDENGKLNISVTNTPSGAKNKRTIAALNDSDVSMEFDEAVVPPEPKKKTLSSKITDYFKTNPI